MKVLVVLGLALCASVVAADVLFEEKFDGNQ
jgi:hypothetical protein